MKEQELYGVIVLVRRLFHELAATVDELHVDLDITAAQRAVLESLSVEGAATVPDLARRKKVTRQHIQILVNSLVQAGRAELVDNPAHRRSALVRISEQGAELFRQVRTREKRVLGPMAKRYGLKDLKLVVALLGDMAGYLEESRT